MNEAYYVNIIIPMINEQFYFKIIITGCLHSAEKLKLAFLFELIEMSFPRGIVRV